MISRWMSSVKVNTNNLKPPSSFNIGIVRVIFGRIYPPHKKMTQKRVSKWIKLIWHLFLRKYMYWMNVCIYIYIHVDMISYIKFLLTQDSKVFEECRFWNLWRVTVPSSSMLLAPNQRRLRQWNKGRCWSRWPTTKHTLSTRYLDLKIDVKRKLFSQVNKWIKKHRVRLRFTKTNLPHLNNWCRIFP